MRHRVRARQGGLRGHPARALGPRRRGFGRRRRCALAAGRRCAPGVRSAAGRELADVSCRRARAAVAAGVALLTGCAVSRVIVEDGLARGVVADGERFEADAVLLTAGAWTSALVASFGGRLPVEPRRGQMVALEHVPAVLTHCIHSDDTYLVPRPSGELLIGATVERVGFQRAVTAQPIATLLSTAITLVPALARLPITRTWFGFRPWAPDNLPILGPWPGIDNLWVATAHYRSGILLAPITARLLTEWIVGGGPSMALDEFLPDRFVKD